MEKTISVFGIFCFLGFAFLLSNNKKKVDYKFIISGVLLQFVLAISVLGIPALNFSGPLRPLFKSANIFFTAILNFTGKGTEFLFGNLMNIEKSGFIIAFQVLPVIIFLSALMAVLYHLKIMQKVVHVFAWFMHKTLKVSGAESLAAAANVFVGQTEAPLIIKPFINKLTRSELFSVMVGGMATVAGSVFAAYVGLLKDKIPDIAGHLLTASVLSAPAALVIAKILIPETQKTETDMGIPDEHNESPYQNMIEAAAQGATDGLKLMFNVAAMLLAFIALIAMANAGLGYIGSLIGFESWGGFLSFNPNEAPTLSLNLIFSWIFAPVAWLMGIPNQDIFMAANLLGEKVVINEFVAYLNMSAIADQLQPRSLIILSYALCGFANFSSIAIQIGGIGGIAPTRKTEVAFLGIKAIIGGSLAAFITACIAGLFI